MSEVLVAATREHHIPGTALGQKDKGREEHASFGPASLSSLFSVTSEALLQIGSLSKIFTTTAAWRLAAYGALTCEVPTRSYLPNLTLAGAATWVRVTVAHLGRVW